MKDDTKKKTRDIECMRDAYKVMDDYFTKNNNLAQIEALLDENRVCFIRQTYKKTSDSEIKLFVGINVGRTALTDAELIRAKLLLSLKDEEEDKTSVAKKWDEIEHCLQNNKMWYFLTDEHNENASRILYIFNAIRDDIIAAIKIKKSDFTFEANSSKHSTYRFFRKYSPGNEAGTYKEESVFKSPENLKNMWARTVEIYEILYKWFMDIEIYNYVGLLLTEKRITVNDLLKEYNSAKSRRDFINYLKSEILYSFDDRDITNIWPYAETQDDENKRLIDALFNMPPKYDYPDEPNNVFIKELEAEKSKKDTSKWIRISVTDADDGFPISGVEVTVGNDKYKTDSQGKIEISDIKKVNVKYDIEITDQEFKPVDGISKLSVTIDKDTKNQDILFAVKSGSSGGFNPMIQVFKSLSYSGRDNEKKLDEYSHRERCHSFLLWSNCELLIRQMKNNKANDKDVVFDMYRFAFDSYKTDRPDVEHVDSFVDMTEEKKFENESEEQRYWLECLIPFLDEKTVNFVEDEWAKEKPSISNIVDAVNRCLYPNGEGDRIKKFEPDKKIEEKDIYDIFEDRRKIANLTLLDKNINRGYKNFPFNIKRQDIIQKGLAGIYVYPCTKMVFLKEFAPNTTTLTAWSSTDYYNYWRFLLDLFIKCFCSDADNKYVDTILKMTNTKINNSKGGEN